MGSSEPEGGNSVTKEFIKMPPPVQEFEASGQETSFDKYDKTKESFLLLVLSIIRPTIDIISDIYLMAMLIIEDHPRWAAYTATPLVANYLLSWVVWSNDKRSRSLSWPAALLSSYPQHRAAAVLHLLWKDDKDWVVEKRRMEREVEEVEAFVEAVPSALGLTNIFYLMESPETKIVIGNNLTFFLIKFIFSCLSASIGLAKSLKSGPCRVWPDMGFCSLRFLILFLSCGLSLVIRANVLAVGFVVDQDKKPNEINNGIVIALVTMFLPGLIIGLLSLCHHPSLPGHMLAHPSLLLLPVFTSFTFSCQPRLCGQGEGGEARVVWSTNWTLVNLSVSTVSIVVCALLFADRINVVLYPVAVGSLLFTIVFCLLATSSCSGPSFLGVLKLEDPQTDYVMNEEGDVVKLEEFQMRQETEEETSV